MKMSETQSIAPNPERTEVPASEFREGVSRVADAIGGRGLASDRAAASADCAPTAAAGHASAAIGGPTG